MHRIDFHRRIGRAVAWCLLLTPVFAFVSRGDEPVLSYLYPAGGQKGTTVDVRVGGLYLHDTCGIKISGSGIAVEQAPQKVGVIWLEGPLLPLPDSQQAEDYPKDQITKLNVAADAASGARLVRISTSQGTGFGKPFVVGDLPETVENELSMDASMAPVAIPITINGRLFPREDVDEWSLEVQPGKTLWAELHAARLGYPLEGRLTLLNEKDQVVAESRPLVGGDCLLAFDPPAPGKYRLRIQDHKSAGGQHFVYRLTVSQQEYATSVFPLAGTQGTSGSFQVTGFNVEQGPRTMNLPAGDLGPFAGHRTIWGRIPSSASPSNPVRMEIDSLQCNLEQEPNDAPSGQAALNLPMSLQGRIDRPGDVDHWLLAMKQGTNVNLNVLAGRLGSPLDSVLVVCDESGKELARNDDLAADQSDSQLVFAPPADGNYLVRVEERFSSRGGPAFAYALRVTLGTDPQDYSLAINQDAITLSRGATIKVKLRVIRQGGFAEKIPLRLDGLPPGVSLAEQEIPAGANEIDLSISATADAAIESALVQVSGLAMINGQETRRVATYTIPDLEAEPIDQLLLAVAMPTPFKVVGRYESKFAPRGSRLARRYKIERNGYTGPLEVRLADHQMRHLQGVTGPVVQVPADANEFEYPVTFPAWMEMGRTSRTCVMATGKINDQSGKEHLVSFTSVSQNEQIVAIIGSAMIGLRAEPASVSLLPGRECEVTVHISRDRSIKGAIKLELATPASESGISADPVMVPEGDTKARLVLKCRSPISCQSLPVTIRGISGDGLQEIIGETVVELVSAGE